MLNLNKLVANALTGILLDFFNSIITSFSEVLSNIMGTAVDIFEYPLIISGVKYTQYVALGILVLKGIVELINTYHLGTSGDPDSNPTGYLKRCAQAVAIIVTMPWVVREIFIFGVKLANDIGRLDSFTAGITDWSFLNEIDGLEYVSGALTVVSTAERSFVAIIILLLTMVVMLIAVSFQAWVRGAELALLTVIGSFIALNLTTTSRSLWSQWVRQVIVICVSQGLQIFMIKLCMSLLTRGILTNHRIGMVIGALWVTIKAPSYIKQFTYNTGAGAVAGAAGRQAGTFYIMRRMMAR